jgi:outer membrane protein, heavy metal efflux system
MGQERFMSRKCLALALAAFVASGCYYPVRPSVDAVICSHPDVPIDIHPDLLTPNLGNMNKVKPPTDVTPDTGKNDKKKEPTLVERLEPKGIPGEEAKKIVLDPKKAPLDEIERVVREYFPPMPALGADPRPMPGPNGQPLTLADLQRMAQTSSPMLRQARAAVEAARGAAVQAGLYPNPEVGLNGQGPGPGGGPTYGPWVSQTIVTMGKQKLAQAVATKDLELAELNYRRAAVDLMAKIRGDYFAVLVAQESIRANRALSRLTDEVYNVIVRQLKGGEVATYEPMQVGVFAVQARIALVQARNSYTVAWKQLSADLGLPAMPPTQLAGRIDMPLPLYRYDAVLAHVLQNHTDVLAAETVIDKGRYALRLAEVTAAPDVRAQVGAYLDNTPGAGPQRMVGTLQLSLPVPLWNRNQGGIIQAQGNLMQNVEEPHRVRSELSARVAEAFRRYDENRVLLELYRKEALPKQVQAFRAVVKRHYGAEPDKVSFNDLVSSEQNLVNIIGPYINALGNQWQAVVDVAALLQTDDLFQVVDKYEPAHVPDLESLFDLPCCHPCSTAPDPALRTADLYWPKAGFAAPAVLPPPQKAKEEKKTSAPRSAPPSANVNAPKAATAIPVMPPADKVKEEPITLPPAPETPAIRLESPRMTPWREMSQQD